MEAALDKFEQAVRKIGGNAAAQRMGGVGEEFREEAVQRMFEGFAEVLGDPYLLPKSEKHDPNVQALAVMRWIRKHIGIDGMIDTRLALLKKSDPVNESS